MKTFSLVSLAAGLALTVLGLGFSPTVQEASAWGKDCARSEFKTKLVKDACAKGGQSEAKKAMKTFLKAAKKQDSGLTCKSCHTKLSPSYDLKKDGLQLYKKLGGK